MGDIRIRNVDEATKQTIKASAKSLGMTMEEYMLDLARQDRLRVGRRILAEARKGAKAIYKKHGFMSDSAALIRAEREENGW